MADLPIISGTDVIKASEKVGYQVVRQRGSHFRLHHIKRNPVTVPNYRRISKGLLRKILRDSEVSVNELKNLLK